MAALFTSESSCPRLARRPWPKVAILPGLVLAVLAGCATLESMAPPVDTSLAEFGRTLDADLGQLTLGRHVYITDCARCHSVEPINRYTQTQWRKILPAMAAEAHLSPEKTQAVNAYVFSVLMALQAAEAASDAAGL